MNKEGLIDIIAEKTGYTKKDTNVFINTFMESVKSVVAKGEPIQLIGFGTFKAQDRAERNGKNPRTKEPIVIPATTVPVFKAGETFKVVVDTAKKERDMKKAKKQQVGKK